MFAIRLTLATPLVLLAALLPPATAQCREARLDWAPFAASDLVSTSGLAIDGDTAAVASTDATNGSVLTIHRRVLGEWLHTQTLNSPLGGTQLQGRVALASGWLAIGNVNRNQVYLYRELGGSWQYHGLLEDTDGSLSFGKALDFDESASTLVVGAGNADYNGMHSAGRVVVLERAGTTWSTVAVLRSVAPQAGAFFGDAVAIDGERMIVGAWGAATRGAVETFQRVGGSWLYQRRYEQDGPAPLPQAFGGSVDLAGDRFVVGAFLTATTPSRAYIYHLNAGLWTVEAVLDSGLNDATQFGRELEFDGDRLVVAEHSNSQEVQRGGALWLYERSGTSWNHQATLFAADTQVGIHLGLRVATSGGHLLASSVTEPTHNRGGVYAFSNAWSCPTTNVGSSYCAPGSPNSTGVGAALAARGSDWVVDDLLGFRASDLPPGQNALLIMSATTAQLPFGDGTLCLGGGIARFARQIQAADAAGRAQFAVYIGALPTSPPQAAMPGQSWHFQCFYRDQNPLSTWNLSDAVRVLFR